MHTGYLPDFSQLTAGMPLKPKDFWIVQSQQFYWWLHHFSQLLQKDEASRPILEGLAPDIVRPLEFIVMHDVTRWVAMTTDTLLQIRPNALWCRLLLRVSATGWLGIRGLAGGDRARARAARYGEISHSTDRPQVTDRSGRDAFQITIPLMMDLSQLHRSMHSPQMHLAFITSLEMHGSGVPTGSTPATTRKPALMIRRAHQTDRVGRCEEGPTCVMTAIATGIGSRPGVRPRRIQA